MKALRACWRLMRTVAHVLRGVVICAFVFPFCDTARRMRHVGDWNRQLLGVLGIALQVRGTVQPGAVLLAANHVSWLDILAINAAYTARFVSKSDVRQWPVLGWLVACGGTLFIERERKRDALRVVHDVSAALAAGDRIAIFPEGTTSDGHGLLPFHANLMQAAVAGGTPVQPVALRYADARTEVSAAAEYIGDMTLAESVWRIVRADGLRAHVVFLPALPSAGRDRRELSTETRSAIAVALGLPPDA